MEILELWLKRYGKFENHKIALKPGMNIIYGGNETGKTTIHSFIRAMFFGLGRARGRAARMDEYQLRQPWDAPGVFLGSMRIEKDGEIYRIDRCFDRSAQPLTVTCETQLRSAAQPERAMEELLGGISEQAFVNTVFIPQAQAQTDDALAEELRRFMVNSEGTMDAQLDVAQALQTLRKKKKQLEQKKKKEEEQLEAQIEKKLAKAEAIRTELELLKRQKDVHRGPADNRADQSVEDEAQPVARWRWIIISLLLLAGILAVAGAIFLTDLKLRLFLGVAGAVFLILIAPAYRLLQEPDETAGNTGGRQEKAAGQREEARRGASQDYLIEEISVREETYARLQDELETLYQRHVGPAGTDTELAAVTMAMDRICELSSGIYARSGGRLNERASEILCELTGGAYSRVILDETMEVRIYTPERVLGLRQVSGGTMQQIYFALRMAAGELLCAGLQPPVVLDETFAMYDDTRLEAALRWLKKSGRQVILFTCQKREREILARL